jgi:hypothetical protein
MGVMGAGNREIENREISNLEIASAMGSSISRF